MKIFIDQYKPDHLGGGWTFMRNFRKGMSMMGYTFVDTIEECDIFMICGITMTEMSSIYKAKQMGKKIVLRVDNVPRKSRNKRNTPHERLMEVSKMADLVVYQSQWSKEYAGILCGEGVVIYNGVDRDIFHDRDREYSDHRYLFVQYNRDENKRFEEARYFFQLYNRQSTKKKLELHLVGSFSPELINANFDFWNNETIVYHGVLSSQEKMAEIMRSCDVLLYPSFADSCPNTVLEALSCGMMIGLKNKIGGTDELVSPEMHGNPSIDLSIDRMCREYDSQFKTL